MHMGYGKIRNKHYLLLIIIICIQAKAFDVIRPVHICPKDTIQSFHSRAYTFQYSCKILLGIQGAEPHIQFRNCVYSLNREHQ